MSCNIPMDMCKKQKEGVTDNVLYDIETQVLSSILSPSHQRTIPLQHIQYIINQIFIIYLTGFRIYIADSFFVVGTKTNLKYKTIKWKRRMPKSIMTDAGMKLNGYLSEKKYPNSFRLILSYNEKDIRNMKQKCSIYEVLLILSISLTDKIHLHDLFEKSNFNDVKDLNAPNSMAI